MIFIEKVEEKKISLKQKILKTIFYLTFIPYIIFFICSIFAMINGVNFMFDTAYGWEALLVMGIVAIFYSPIFIICFIYQILFKILTKKHLEYKQYNTKKFIILTIIVFIVFIISIMIYSEIHQYLFENSFYEKRIEDMQIIVIPYRDDYSEVINTINITDSNGLYNFMWDYYEDFIEYTFYFREHYSSFMIMVSPIIEGNIESYEKPKIEYSSGKEKLRTTAIYNVDKSSTDKYIIVYLLEGYFREFKDYSKDLRWKER